MDYKEGRFTAKALPETVQYGTSGTQGTLTIGVDVRIPELNGTATTLLYFSAAAKQYADERLRAMGWKGNDYAKLEGLGSTEFQVEVRKELYDGKTTWKVEVVTGNLKLASPLSASEFANRLKAMSGAPAAAAGGKDSDVPF
jgi:hypothetical protein